MTNTAKSTADSALAKANQALTKIANGEVSVIKSIQRGESNGNSGLVDISISINNINPNKTIILLDTSYGNQCVGCHLISINSNSFTVCANVKFSWQVVEFN